MIVDVVSFDVVIGRGWSVMWSVSSWSLLVGDNVSPGDAPAIIMQYVAWMEREFNACQTPHSMYLSIFNSFRVIRIGVARHYV